MWAINNLCKNEFIKFQLFYQLRYKSKTHWAKLRKKTGPKYKALNHFDEFYGSVFGDKWEPMREALLRRSKYVAVINNYGDTEETVNYLTNRGAHCLKKLMQVQNDFHNKYMPEQTENKLQTDNHLDSYAAKLQTDEMSKIYPQNHIPGELEVHDVVLKSNRLEEEFEKKENVSENAATDRSTAQTEIDESRIIDPSMGITNEALYQYLPATKLKGMDDYVPESLHYSYYSKDKDFPLLVEPETEFKFPEHLKVYTYEMDSEWTMFPEPKRCQTGVYNYYPMDCGSVLAVLALCLSPGDRVLDLCSGPGGKALVALQTLLPDIIVCNDISQSRLNRIQRTFRDYLIDFDNSNRWRERVLFKRVDGRHYTDDQGFDKVLVDVPCTTDRHSVTEDDNSMFRADRVRERLRLPEMQSQILANALSLVKVGGSVVYSTCSLSPVQNDGVVHMALKQAFESQHVVATVKDLSAPLTGLSSTLLLAKDSAGPRYGQLVVPSVGANFGPSYIARLVRVK